MIRLKAFSGVHHPQPENMRQEMQSFAMEHLDVDELVDVDMGARVVVAEEWEKVR